MPDLPSSPRKPVSSVSAQARQQKKPGAPKPKGAVRAKSGCYTCRIRRKKCDEQSNGPDGACQTCTRLRLQCLGFGAKRPDWMRENNSVTELREKIKTFLASQGMIKGHSGSGPRSSEQDPPVLVLVDHIRQSPSSPPTPTLSASSSDGHRPHGLATANTSFMREGSHQHQPPHPQQPHYTAVAPEPPYNPSTWQPSGLPDLGRSHHDAMGRGVPTMLPPMTTNEMSFSMPSAPMLPPPSNLVPMSHPQSWLPNGASSSSYPSSSAMTISTASSSYHTSSAVTTPSQSYVAPAPAMESSFSPSYNVNYTIDEDDNVMANAQTISIPHQIHTPYDIPLIPNDQTELVDHYLRNVLPIQYLLADSNISNFMFKLIQTSPSARDAACVLSALHLHCIRYPPRSPSTDMTAIFRRIEGALLSDRPDVKTITEGDAMAGLLIVSTFLFSGGRGAWDLYLEIASQFVRNMLSNPRFYGPEDVLKNSSESTRFIIKTTMWFDVLASVTTLQVPRFLETYRMLFGRTGAYIDDSFSSSPEISMLPVMGCENQIVLAIAEISNLAHWKEGQKRRGCLSVPQLVERGLEIESKYLSGVSGGFAQPASNPAELEIAQRRRLTNDIFRASARVYLHTVLSGDYPACPEIVAGVAETIACLRRVPENMPVVSRSVVRSVVFGICICGCLTDDHRQRSFLLKMLETQQQQGDSVGNISEVRQLMEQVWARRENSQGRPVNWRDVMRESQRDLLLLV